MESKALMHFDVHVHPRPDGGADLHATVGGDGGQDSGSVAKDVVDHLRTIRDQLDAVDDLHGKDPQIDFNSSRTHGRAVFKALFAGPVERLYRERLKQARHQARTLVIRVMYDTKTLHPGQLMAIHEAPWELAFDPAEEQFLALWPETCLSRYLRMPLHERPLVRRTAAPLLLSVAQSTKMPLNSEEEYTRLRAVTSRNMDVVKLPVDGSRPLCQALSNAARKEHPFVGWHHVGHGTIDKQTEEFALLFERDAGEYEEVSLTQIVKVVAESRVQCAVLNICYGGTSHGLATAIASANVPIVVGHRTTVYDSACISFASTFWRELSAGSPAELAMRMARMSVLARGLGSHWALPMLFVRVNDTRLMAEPH